MKPKAVCCVCDREYEPDPARGRVGEIYCSASCAWDISTNRTKESLLRELAALWQSLEKEEGEADR